jgi:hypothetical protein
MYLLTIRTSFENYSLAYLLIGLFVVWYLLFELFIYLVY